MSTYADDVGDEGGNAAERAAAYEEWISTVLRPKLQEHRSRKAKLEEEAGQYAELKQKLSGIMVREDDGPLEMLSDLGADCFTKVQVDDPNTVFVHVALGFHVEFTLPEAMSFSDVKRNSLGSALAKVATREAEIAQDLVSAESMVQELRALAESDR